MISSSSLSAFSSAQGIGGTPAPARPQRPPAGVQEARTQPQQPGQALQARPGGASPGQVAPGQTLPRGSLLDLSV